MNGTGPDVFAKIENALVVGGDDEFIEFGALGSTLKNMLQEGFSQKRMQGLSGEAGGGPTGRNDANDSRIFRNYKVPPSTVYEN